MKKKLLVIAVFCSLSIQVYSQITCGYTSRGLTNYRLQNYTLALQNHTNTIILNPQFILADSILELSIESPSDLYNITQNFANTSAIKDYLIDKNNFLTDTEPTVDDRSVNNSAYVAVGVGLKLLLVIMRAHI